MDTVLIIGAGQAGIEAACTLREQGFPGSITVIGGETQIPYQRPPLSKDLAAGGELPLLPLRSPSVLEELRVQWLAGSRAESIDRDERLVTVLDADGDRSTLGYDHLVLATGAVPRGAGPQGSPLPGQDAAGIHVLRTADDAAALAAALTTATAVTVIGGGVIGLEFATIAAASGAHTTVLERGERFLRRFVGDTTSAWLLRAHTERGVEVRSGTSVAGFRADEHGAVAAVILNDGTEVASDLVLVGTGVDPASDLAAAAGLECEGGVVVDARLRTSDPRISAIGDCAVFPCHYAPGTRRVECVQNATDQGRYLGRCLAALAAFPAGEADKGPSAHEPEPYRDVPWFWSVQAGVKIQVAGIAGAHDAEVVLGDPGIGKFSVLRFDGPRLTCVESIGRPADHLTARKLLTAGNGPTLEDALAGRVDTLKAWSAAIPV